LQLIVILCVCVCVCVCVRTQFSYGVVFLCLYTAVRSSFCVFHCSYFCFCVLVPQLPCVFVYVHCSYIVFLCLVSILVLVPFEDNTVKH